MKLEDKIFIAGHRGMVGSAIRRTLKDNGYTNVITKTRQELNLLDKSAVDSFFQTEKPDIVIIAAAKVGGIHANNTYPVEFLTENVAIAQNLISGAYDAGIKRVLFLGSSCIYPCQAQQPIKEEYLLTGTLEPTNEAYAIAKIAGMKLCQYYRTQYGVTYHSLMPTNLYGPGDNYHPENSHVLPALIRRFHEAKEAQASEVPIWGTGTPRREFLHAEDVASAALHFLKLDNPPDWVNIGMGEDVTILEAANLVKKTIGYEGTITFDPSKPDGMPRKLLDISLAKSYGWTPSIPLEEGLTRTYQDFLKEHVTAVA